MSTSSLPREPLKTFADTLDQRSMYNADDNGSYSCSTLDGDYCTDSNESTNGKRSFRMRQWREPHHDSSGSDSVEVHAQRRRRRRHRRRRRRAFDQETTKGEPGFGDTLRTLGDKNDGTAECDDNICSIAIGVASPSVITNISHFHSRKSHEDSSSDSDVPRCRGRKSHEDSSSNSDDLQKRENDARFREQIANLGRRSSDEDDWRNRAHIDPTQLSATETVKRDASEAGTLLTDEEVDKMRTSMLPVGVNSGRGAEERRHYPCSLETGSNDDSTAASLENEESATEDAARGELDGAGTMGGTSARSERFGGVEDDSDVFPRKEGDAGPRSAAGKTKKNAARIARRLRRQIGERKLAQTCSGGEGGGDSDSGEDSGMFLGLRRTGDACGGDGDSDSGEDGGLGMTPRGAENACGGGGDSDSGEGDRMGLEANDSRTGSEAEGDADSVGVAAVLPAAIRPNPGGDAILVGPDKKKKKKRG